MDIDEDYIHFLKKEIIEVITEKQKLKLQLQECREENEKFIDFLRKELMEALSQKTELKKQLQACREEKSLIIGEEIELKEDIEELSSGVNNK